VQPIAITLGDPAGIGAEIVFKALQEVEPAMPLRLFGDWALARQSPGGELLDQIPRATTTQATGDPRWLFIDVGDAVRRDIRWGTIGAAYGQVALASIAAALDAIDAGTCSALVTAPIHKQSIAAAGSRFPGHTEILASRAGLTRYGYDFAMYFDSPTIRVALLSVHLPLRDAIAQITPDAIAALARLVSREFERLHDRKPRLAAAGLNPHAGEGGMFGDEERLIARGVEMAAADGITISGPHAADTVFHAARLGRFDAVLAMYHDQGLIAVKTAEFERSVNVTLGLPYLRCSVDHGTAFDIAGQGIANAAPMTYAIQWASRHAERFARR
jgi:4-hydroxythreonine-4-phosphate dehydrogenase